MFLVTVDLKIFVTGTRGIPNIPGGVEKHCQELYPRIAAAGHEVILATRSPYVTKKLAHWQDVQLCHLFAPRKKSIEAIIHTFFAVIKARMLDVDILHIHAVGPGLMAPFARLLGLKVVITNHGPDYDRGKWGKGAKAVLRLGEWLGGKFGNEVIVISAVITAILKKRCGRKTHLIYNGVTLPTRTPSTGFLDSHTIRSGKYILAVARFVPEKGLHDLIEAFSRIDGDSQLVIAGDADHETEYSRELKEKAAQDSRIILTGYITGEDLNQIYTHARLFVMPSYHEGLPIALLEALSYELPVLVSDIPANMEIALDEKRFFACGDVEDLLPKINALLPYGLPLQEADRYRRMLEEKYNWDVIAKQTIAVYEKALLC